jgi:uncharacterized membrane protein
MQNFVAGLTIAAVLGSGLVAGTFFAFSTFIMPAFAARPAKEATAAMQEINTVILRSGFIAVFLGTAAVSTVLIGVSLFGDTGRSPAFAIAGSALYLAGCFLVTIVFNVPLNNNAAKIDPDGPLAATEWNDYADPWTRWNHVRTIASAAAVIMFAGYLAR